MKAETRNTHLLRRLSALCLMALMSTWLWAQSVVVTGMVQDEKGAPIVGALVLEHGTTNGSVTDFDGRFSLTVGTDAVLDASFLGYASASEAVNGRSSIVFMLKDELNELDELMVIGYGVQKKSVVTAAIAKVGAEELSQVSPTRVDNALKGLAAGVQVTTQNGQPGASSVVRVRGTGTINNSDPLYIVDGMPIGGGIDNINPADIASIEVLKDAASAAVYGARAANGVVLVTTKRGAQGKVDINYEGSFGWQSAWRKREMLNAREYATLMNEAAAYAGQEAKFFRP